MDCSECFLDAKEVGEAVSEGEWFFVNGGAWLDYWGLAGAGDGLAGSWRWFGDWHASQDLNAIASTISG